MSESGANDVFAAVFLINLKRRPDRLAAALDQLRRVDWPFCEPIVFPAVDGHALPTPHEWGVGPGAWGCRQSHIRILEDCMQSGVESVLIPEDDICLCANFAQRCRQFLEMVPSNWEGVMLGGNHLESAHIGAGIVRCLNTAWTLAYGVRGRLLYDLYRNWTSVFDGIDSVFAMMQRRYHVYAPHPFVATPSGLTSDISCVADCNRTVTSHALHDRAKLFRTTKTADGRPLLILHAGVEGLNDYCVRVAAVPEDVASNLAELKRWLRENVEAARRDGNIHFAIRIGAAMAATFGTWENVMYWLRQAWDPIIEVRAAEDITPYLPPR